jgi:hypothetical protein
LKQPVWRWKIIQCEASAVTTFAQGCGPSDLRVAQQLLSGSSPAKLLSFEYFTAAAISNASCTVLTMIELRDIAVVCAENQSL